MENVYFKRKHAIGETLEGRCIDNSDEEIENVCADVTQLALTSYMPYGKDGPRITASGAASVLMRYLALIKTDTSYPLKILYSAKKEFGGYQMQLLMPPPSPLQDIITGPWCSSKTLAKQLVRVEACKHLHRAGLLGRDLLPINFRKLISLAKNTTLSSQTDQADKREEKDQLINSISRVSLGPNPPESQEPLNIMSHANLLLTPMDGDIFMEDSIHIDPFIVQNSTDTETTATVSPEADCVGDFDEELPPGIVLCEPASLKLNQPQISKEKEKPLPPPPPPPQFSDYQKTPPQSRRQSLVVYDNHIVDDELPMEKKSKKGRNPQNRSRFYQIHRLYSISAPYQEPIQPGRACYLYTWRLPSAENVATCTKIDVACFRHTNQTLGLLFSKPIANNFQLLVPPTVGNIDIIGSSLRLELKVEVLN
ncbi:hypothetical protein ACTXT7_010702 [Hymenolepis weldensis]